MAIRLKDLVASSQSVGINDQRRSAKSRRHQRSDSAPSFCRGQKVRLPPEFVGPEPGNQEDQCLGRSGPRLVAIVLRRSPERDRFRDQHRRLQFAGMQYRGKCDSGRGDVEDVTF